MTTKTKTTTPSHIPAGVVIAARNSGIIGSTKNGAEGALVVAKVRKNKGEDNGYTLWTGHGRFDLAATDKVTWTADAEAATDAIKCGKHGTIHRPWVGGYECGKCWNEYEKARNAAIKAGTWQPRGRSEAEKAERAERVQEAAMKAERSRNEMIGTLLRKISQIAEQGRGQGKNRNAAWAACRMTDTCNQYGITPEQGAAYAGIDAFAPMTWAEYRATYPTRNADADTDAA